MSPGESAALVALLRAGAQPPQHYTELVERAGSAVAVLEQELSSPRTETAQATLFPSAGRPAGHRAEAALAQADADIRAWSAEGMCLVSVLDPEYPENLRLVHDRPPLIFVAGRLTEADARSIAVIGARRATPEGQAVAGEIARHLVHAGFTVLSGLAAGVDTAAHTAALSEHGRTVAVIGTGLRRAYPPQNADLQARIAREGAVVSQFWPETPPSRTTFPMRNAVMSGLALASVVVEASPRSGARVQARLALAHGRPVFLHRRLLGEEWARELAMRPGAHVISQTAQITDIVDRLGSSGALSP